MTTFTAEGKTYELAYTIGRIKLYEDSDNLPIQMALCLNGGVLKISELETLMSYGMKEAQGDYIDPEEALLLADALIEENGYIACLDAVHDALDRDCGFLFMIRKTEEQH